MRRENPSTQEKTSQSRVEDQQTQPTCSVEDRIQPRSHWWRASVLTTAPTLFSKLTYLKLFKIISPTLTTVSVVSIVTMKAGLSLCDVALVGQGDIRSECHPRAMIFKRLHLCLSFYGALPSFGSRGTLLLYTKSYAT